MRASLCQLGVIAATLAAAGAKDPAGAGGTEAQVVKHVDAAAAKELLAKKPKAGEKPLVVLDVRTAEEFAGGHIPGAVQVDFLSDGFQGRLEKLDRATPYLLHCRSGGRSSKALAAMRKLGFKTVYHLDGGIAAWLEAGGAVVKK